MKTESLRKALLEFNEIQKAGQSRRFVLIDGAPVTIETALLLAAENLDRQTKERDALLWVLWHHQGGSSPVGQPIRRALGIGQFDHLTAAQVLRAKSFAKDQGVDQVEAQ